MFHLPEGEPDDPVSLNLEAPNTERLRNLAPHKTFMEELVRRLLWVEQIRKNRSPFKTWNGRWPSSATQFVVGAVGESGVLVPLQPSKRYSPGKSPG